MSILARRTHWVAGLSISTSAPFNKVTFAPKNTKAASWVVATLRLVLTESCL